MPKCTGRYQIIPYNTPGFSHPNKGVIPHMYIVALDKSLRALLVHEKVDSKENVIYCLSLTLVGPKKGICQLKCVFGANIRHMKITTHLEHYSTKFISKVDPLKYILSQLNLHGRPEKRMVLVHNMISST